MGAHHPTAFYMNSQYKREASWLIQEKYQGHLTAQAKKDLVKLAQGEPVDYLIGFVEFAGCKIDVSFRPLIPRPETEYWTLETIEELKEEGKEDIACLDMFAGSGCIGMAVLKHLPKAKIDFAEKERKLKKQILLNLKHNGFDNRGSRVLTSDVFSKVSGMYDCILANPPYIPETEQGKVQKSVVDYEPLGALFAGEDGLKYIRRFLKEAKSHLHSGGRIIMEFDSPQKSAIERLADREGYASCECRKDQYGKWRWCEIIL